GTGPCRVCRPARRLCVVDKGEQFVAGDAVGLGSAIVPAIGRTRTPSVPLQKLQTSVPISCCICNAVGTCRAARFMVSALNALKASGLLRTAAYCSRHA